MKKLILLLFTVAGGLYVQTVSPDRQEREPRRVSGCSSKYSYTRKANIHALRQTKLSWQA